jgi:hypothetical protein
MIINKAVAITPRILTSIVNLLLTLSQCLALVDLLTSKKKMKRGPNFLSLTDTKKAGKLFTKIFCNFAINTLRIIDKYLNVIVEFGFSADF